MYPHLIEVHQGESPVTLNIDHIMAISPYSDPIRDMRFNSLITNSVGHPAPVKETYEELKQLIFDAGCHIQKADPRLDNKQLTMDDLENMFGEPVFNSNTRKWGIVGEYKGGDNPSVKIKYPFELAPTVTCYWDDLIKFPLYRMKVTE